METLAHFEPICHLAGAIILIAIVIALMRWHNLTPDQRERLKIAESLIHVIILVLVGVAGLMHSAGDAIV